MTTGMAKSTTDVVSSEALLTIPQEGAEYARWTSRTCASVCSAFRTVIPRGLRPYTVHANCMRLIARPDT